MPGGALEGKANHEAGVKWSTHQAFQVAGFHLRGPSTELPSAQASAALLLQVCVQKRSDILASIGRSRLGEGEADGRSQKRPSMTGQAAIAQQ